MRFGPGPLLESRRIFHSRDVDETRAWQQTIPDSELLVLPGDSYHVAASDATQCAQASLAFIERRDPDKQR